MNKPDSPPGSGSGREKANRCFGQAALVALFVLLAAFLPEWPAGAGAASDNLPISARVRSACRVRTTDLKFGNYEGARINVTATVRVRCVRNRPYDITMNAGMHFNGRVRGVAKAGARIPYRLFQATGKEWGDTGFADTYPRGVSQRGIGTGRWQNYIVTGEISPGIVAPPGRYTDTVGVTVRF